jgi:hypothetical protein
MEAWVVVAVVAINNSSNSSNNNSSNSSNNSNKVAGNRVNNKTLILILRNSFSIVHIKDEKARKFKLHL